MSNTEPLMGAFHDAITHETVIRKLTPEEIAELPKPSNETPTAD